VSHSQACPHGAEAEHRALPQTADDAIFTVDRDGRLLSANPAAVAALGRPMAEIVGRPVRELFAAAIGQRQAAAIRRVFETGEPLLNQVNETHTVLGARWYSTSLTPVPDGDGGVASVLGVARDVTAAQTAEARCVEGERFLQVVFDSIQDGISVLDRDRTIVRVNHWMEARHGNGGVELVGRKCYEAYRGATGPCAVCPTQLALDRGEPQRAIVRGFTDGRQWGWLDLSAFPLRNGAGEVVGVIEHVRDITEQRHAEEVLARSETTYRAILDAVSDGISVREIGTWRILDVNRTWCEMYGYTVAEARQLTVRDLSAEPDSYDAYLAKAAAGEPQLVEWRIRHRSGSVVETELSTQRANIAGHDRVLTISRDITRRRQAERALRESEERHRLLLASLPHSVFFKDRDGRFLSVNAVFAGELGMTAGDIIGKTDFDLYPTELATKYQADDQRVMAGGRPETLVERNVAGGRERIVEVTKAPVVQDDGQVIGVMGLFKDLTEQRQAELQTARLATAAEQAGEAIIVADPLGVIEYVNPAFERITGYRRDEVVGRTAEAVQGGESTAFFHDGVWPEVRQGRVWSGRSARSRQDGTPLEVEITVSPVRDPSGAMVNVVAVARDVTQEVALEAQLRQAQKLDAIGALAGGVAHDFNNLLTGILGYASIIKLQTQPGEAVFRAAEVIEVAARRAAELTGQLLGLARKGKHQNVPVDLHAVIQEVIGLLVRTIPKDITIRQRFGADAATVLGDPSQMQQVMLNLAINARDAMPEGGELSFDTDIVELDEAYCGTHAEATRGSHLMVAVTDTGCGIPEEVRERIFEPFFTTKEHGEGTGMGLAMAYGIVKNHNGFIQVYSEVGHGTIFRVYLPLLAAAAPAATDGRATDLVVGTGRILLVDDEEVVREVAVDILRHLGYQVVTAADGEEAVEYYRQFGAEIDLVVIDMVMPRLDGRGCFRALKQLDPGVRAVLSTGYGLNGAAQSLLDEGMVGFAQKPYEARQLSAVVADALAASAENPTDPSQ